MPMSGQFRSFLAHCQPGCGVTFVRFGIVVGAGEVPTHGKTVHCPKCGAGRTWDATQVMTAKMHAFSREGASLGEIRPVGEE